MISRELAQTIRLLELHTRRLMINQASGMSQGAQRGFGFEFDTLDDYQEGDDIRYLDHVRSAQQNKLIIKRYRDEPIRTVVVMVDTSTSTLYGTKALINAVQGEIATAITLAASYANDMVGALLFAQGNNTYIPPRRGRAGIMDLIETVVSASSSGTTSMIEAAQYVMDRLHKRALVIVVSDCVDENYQKAFRMLRHRYDLAVIRVVDTYSMTLPPLDLIAAQDSEKDFFLEPLLKSHYNDYQNVLHNWHQEQHAYCVGQGIDFLSVVAGMPWFDPVVHFFMQRRCS